MAHAVTGSYDVITFTETENVSNLGEFIGTQPEDLGGLPGREPALAAGAGVAAQFPLVQADTRAGVLARLPAARTA